jgi:lipopolysaccharide heptosyltransferase II
MLDFCIYLLYRAGVATIRTLPLRFLFRAGEILGLAGWILLPNYRRLALRNVTIALGDELSPRARRRLVRRHFARLTANALCGVRMTAMSREQLLSCVEIDAAPIEAELLAGRPAVVVLSHLGNWEAFAQLFPLRVPQPPSGAVFQQLRNRRISAHLRQLRSRRGMELFDRAEGFAAAAQLLRRGGVLGVLGDQHAGDHGVWTPFFGRLASTSRLPALLARRTGALLFAGSFQTVGIARWRMSFSAALGTPEESINALTARANHSLEQQVHCAPEDWFWVHNRWKTPNPNFLLTHYKRGVYLPPIFSRAKLKPFRILVRAPNWLGDSVIAVPGIRAIKRGRPDAHLTILAPEKLAAMWRIIAEVDEVIAMPQKSLAASARLLREQEPFDVAIVLPNSLRSALEVWLAGIPRRAGFRGHQRAWLLNQIVLPRQRNGPLEHQVHKYLHLARLLGAESEFAPFACSEGELTSAKLRLAISPGAEYGPAKRWLPERFAEAAAAVAKSRPVECVLVGTSNDESIGALVAGALEANCTNLIGQTSLEQLIDELRRCHLLLTNDTGTMHLATLLGRPVVAVFGSTEPRLTGPLGARQRVIRHHVECSPCFLRECPIDFRCMHAIGSAEVAQAVLDLLSQVEAARPVSTSPEMAR